MGRDEIHQIDLVDVASLARYNGGNKYLLTCIDVFSKYAWVRPLKNKTGQAIVSAYEDILESDERPPIFIHSDKGSEFTNRIFQNFLRKKGIRFYTTNSEVKASIVERFNRTLKGRMWKYFTLRSTFKYISVLTKLVKGYNNSYHRSIRMKPIDVDDKNDSTVWKKIYIRTGRPLKHLSLMLETRSELANSAWFLRNPTFPLGLKKSLP